MKPELFEAIISSMFYLENQIDSLQKRLDTGELDELGFDLVTHIKNRHQKHWEAFRNAVEEREK